MPDTKRFEKKAKPETPGTELQARVLCKGKSASAVLDEIRNALVDAEVKHRDPLVVLEELGQLQDSIMTLMKGISRLLVGYPRTVTFWESSGYTEAFLSVLEKDSR